MLRHSARIAQRWFLTVVLAASFAACGADERADSGIAAEVPEAERYGGTVVLGATNDLQTLNALTSSDYNSSMIQQNVMFMTLVRYDRDLKPVPWLAEQWDTVRVAPDSLELTFHLRRDVKWHDGVPTTAADVLFTYRRARDPQTAYPNAESFALYADGAVLVDPHTVRFRLRSHADFLDVWRELAIMPAHVLAGVPADQLARDPFGTQRPVGNGPFRFVRHVEGREWVFEANPDFPDSLGGRPYLDRLVYRSVPDQTTLLTELLTGRVDIALDVPPSEAARVENAPLVRLGDVPFRQWVFVVWNARNPLFDTAEERRALTLAIDRRRIVDAVLFGYGDVGRSTITPAHWSFTDKVPATTLPYDTAAARRLLAQSGWADRDGDGILEDPRGRPFQFVLKISTGNQLRRDIAEIIQAQLRPIGIEVELQVVEWTTLIQQLQADGAGGARDFDATILGLVDFFHKDDTNLLHTRSLGGAYQWASYSDPQTDRLLDTLARLNDRDAAAPLWHAYQQRVVEQSPFTVLYYPRRLVGVRERLNNVRLDIRGELGNVRRWWIPPAEREQAARAAGAGVEPS